MCPARNGLRENWECRAAQISAKATSASKFWTEAMIELPGVREDGMLGRNGQRKPGTTRGSPRRSRTAKASPISRSAVKSRCARKWDGGRLSDDGPRQHNSNRSEDPWGGGRPTLHGGARSSPRPDTVHCVRAGRAREVETGAGPHREQDEMMSRIGSHAIQSNLQTQAISWRKRHGCYTRARRFDYLRMRFGRRRLGANLSRSAHYHGGGIPARRCR